MKSRFILVVIFTVWSIISIGCGAKTEKVAEKKFLKPADIVPDKAVKIDDLIDGVFADVSAWKDKEITVSGYIVGISGSLITTINDKDSKSRKSVSCSASADVPSDMLSKPVEFKGKIKRMEVSDYQTETRFSIQLDPCEIKK